MSVINSLNKMKYHALIIDLDNKSISIIMEKCESLKDELKKRKDNNNNDLLMYFSELVKYVQSQNDAGNYFYDLKPDNILFCHNNDSDASDTIPNGLIPNGIILKPIDPGYSLGTIGYSPFLKGFQIKPNEFGDKENIDKFCLISILFEIKNGIKLFNVLVGENYEDTMHPVRREFLWCDSLSEGNIKDKLQGEYGKFYNLIQGIEGFNFWTELQSTEKIGGSKSKKHKKKSKKSKKFKKTKKSKRKYKRKSKRKYSRRYKR